MVVVLRCGEVLMGVTKVAMTLRCAEVQMGARVWTVDPGSIHKVTR